MPSPDDRFDIWLDGLHSRFAKDLTFQEIRRGVQALSALYVEKRSRLDATSPFDGAGKRAAFAAFYAPLHFLLVREILRTVKAIPVESILDLGCGTGAAGAAWAVGLQGRPRVTGVDQNPWAIQEARRTYREFGIRGTGKCQPIESVGLTRARSGILLAFTANELRDDSRARLLGDLISAVESGSSVLLVEPVARRGRAWWEEWSEEFLAHGGRVDQWRFPLALPEPLRALDKAAGLDHRELTGRSLFVPAS